MFEVIGKIVVILVVIFSGIAAIASIGLLMAWPIKWTWNFTMPYIFGLPAITWGKAWCLHFLSKCLIKSYNSVTAKK